MEKLDIREEERNLHESCSEARKRLLLHWVVGTADDSRSLQQMISLVSYSRSLSKDKTRRVLRRVLSFEGESTGYYSLLGQGYL